ncbi:MAG: hypothetical protein ACYDHF_04170 [Candidatus Cryosericum sp.]
MLADTPSVLIVHSAAGHSGKTTVCRALVRDLPFDIYVKLSRHSPHLVQCSASGGTLPPDTGDSGLLHNLQRSPWLSPLTDVYFLDGPRLETDATVQKVVDSRCAGTRFLIEGYCSPVEGLMRYVYMFPCPLPETAKQDIAVMVQRADLLVINRFPGCEAAAERALTTVLRDANPHAAVLSGSTQDQLFIDTIEAAVIELMPALAHP